MMGTALARAWRLLALTALAAALIASAERAHSSRAEACAGATSGRTKVGAITRIFHTSVFVRSRYISAAPCDLLTGDVVKTDLRGEAVLRLAVEGRETTCALLQRVTLNVYPASQFSLSSTRRRVVSFSAGRTWCSRKGRTTAKSLYSAGQAKFLTDDATFGVEVDRGTVLVKVALGGTLRVWTQTAAEVLRRGKAALISPKGKITGPVTARFDAKDGLALARLR
jgi:hypothetical protein